MEKKRKVMIVSLNRSEYSRIRSVVKELLERKDLNTKIAVLHSKFANNSILFEDDGFPVDYKVNISIGERSPANTAAAVGEVTTKFAKIFHKEKPEVLVILGDRYEALGVVIAAAFQNIFIAHIQGGEVTGTHDEHTRHAITKLSHLHFPATKLAGERVVKMGEDPKMVFTVGCPGTDMLLKSPELTFKEFKEELYKITNRSEILERLEPDFLLVLQFPVPTELEAAEKQIKETVQALSEFPHSKLILTPIPDAGGDIVEKVVREYEAKDPKAIVVKHLPPDLFINALRLSKVMIGNSSAGIRETGYFAVPTVNIGSRQTGREQSSNITNVPHDKEKIVSAIKKQLEHAGYAVEMIYGGGNAGKKIAEIVATVDCSKIQKKLFY
ncbi:MAG: UDP-N-acetylglucosamine 2-epimerase [Minisyncoccia bacterium]